VIIINGEKLGSIKVDDDPSDSPKKAAKKAPAKAETKASEPVEKDDVEFKSALDDDDDRPNVSDLKPEWVKYAVAQGLDEDKAEDMTKQELIDKYGGD